MFNIQDDKEIVLGNFNVSGVSEKRIFISEKFDFFPENDYCAPVEYMWIPFLNLPIYFIGDPMYNIIVNRECVDCTLLGGTTEKPDFWE